MEDESLASRIAPEHAGEKNPFEVTETATFNVVKAE